MADRGRWARCARLLALEGPELREDLGGGRIWAANGKTGAVRTFMLPVAGHLDVISGSYLQPDDGPRELKEV